MNWMRKLLAVVVLSTGAMSYARSAAKPQESGTPQPSASVTEVNQDWMLQGEKRYRANCGRCHQPPRKFAAREMATIVRHMRVRAMLTEDDAKYLLYYMTH